MTLQGEDGQAGNGSWFSTHPPLNERIARLSSGMEKYPDRASLAKLPGRFVKSVRGGKAAK